MKIIIGSNTQSHLGVGSLLELRPEDIRDCDYDPNCEEGSWKFEMTYGETNYLTDVRVISSDPGDRLLDCEVHTVLAPHHTLVQKLAAGELSFDPETGHYFKES